MGRAQDWCVVVLMVLSHGSHIRQVRGGGERKFGAVVGQSL
ncbi:hypothetical protein BVRB_5g109470 [Beta vulgaris subsp. vulgaris]|nr:hypothetical protein BVRB_5g109470 [Beta vulgaris subsp. vulgaris]